MSKKNVQIDKADITCDNKAKVRALSRDPIVIPGEIALLCAIVTTSIGTAMMNKGNFGLSAFSSVPFVLWSISNTWTFGTWNYLFQLFLIILLIFAIRKIKLSYVLSFLVAFAFGHTLDIANDSIQQLPSILSVRIGCYLAGFVILVFSIAVFIRSGMPVMAMDMFTRELAEHRSLPFQLVKTCFDVGCLALSLFLSLFFAGQIVGVGWGTIVCSFVTGKCVSVVAAFLDGLVVFRPRFWRDLSRAQKEHIQ